MGSAAHHSAFVSGGQLLVCGTRLVGRDGNASLATVPTPVPALPSVRIVSVFVGSFHTLALSHDGVPYSFAVDSAAVEGILDLTVCLLGHGDDASSRELSSTPRPVSALAGTRVVAVAAGSWCSLFLGEAGTVFSCGASRQCGHLSLSEDPFGIERRAYPRAIEALGAMRVGAISAGSTHNLVLVVQGAEGVGGSIYSFGTTSGQALGALGFGEDVEVQPTPRLVDALARERCVAVATGGSFSLALAQDGLCNDV